MVNATDGWACYSTRRLVACNPARDVELPPGDETRRLRIADPAKAAQLIAALAPDDALACYDGQRRFELDRLRRPDVDDAQLIHGVALKSEAGADRRAPGAAGRRVTLHECRHTHASYLKAAGYTLAWPRRRLRLVTTEQLAVDQNVIPGAVLRGASRSVAVQALRPGSGSTPYI